MPNILLTKVTTKMLTAHFFIISPRFAYSMLSFSSSQCPYSTKNKYKHTRPKHCGVSILGDIPRSWKKSWGTCLVLTLVLTGGWMDNGLTWFLPPSLGSRWSLSLVFMLAPQDMFWLCPHACAYFPWLVSWKRLNFFKGFHVAVTNWLFFLNITYQELILKSDIKFFICVKEMLFSILL